MKSLKFATISLIISFLFISHLITPVFAAEHLNASDFGPPNPQGVGKEYYRPGERLEFLYYIVPASDDKKVKLDNRYYYIYSSLDGVTLRATVFLATGASIQHQYLYGRCQNPEDSCEVLNGAVRMSFNIGDTGGEGGVDEIEVEVKGTIPSVQRRLETVKVLWFEVSDAEPNVLPSVKIRVLNLDQFTKDMGKMKGRYKSLSENASILEERGVVTVDAEDYLEKARNNLTLAENYYKDGDYIESDEKLSSVETMLKKAAFELLKAEAEFVYEKAGDELEKLSVAIVQFDYTIQEAKDEDIPVSSYEFQLITLKSKYTGLVDKNDKTSDYFEKNKFDDVIKRSKSVINESTSLAMQANSLIAELRKKIDEAKETPTPTPKPTPTPTPTSGLFFLEYRDKLVLIGAVIAILIGGGGAAAVAISRYKQKKAFDELK
jgi:hypothetical protein